MSGPGPWLRGEGHFLFGAILALAAALRLAGLGWGLAKGTSFHPDEDKILWQLERMKVSPLDLDPKDFGWGTLQTYLVGGTVFAFDRVGAYGDAWRSAFREGREPYFSRLFVTGRALSSLFGILTVAVVAAIAWEKAGARAGLVAAALLAVSPLHVLHSHYLTADVALGFWLAIAYWAHPRSAVLSGWFTGLALASKPSALLFVPVVVGLAPGGRGRLQTLAAVLGGFLLGEPYTLLAFRAWWSASIETAARIGAATPEAFTLGELMWRHCIQVVLYGLGPVAAAAVVLGFWMVGRALGAAVGALALTLALSRFPMGRYAVPLLPFLAVAAGLAVNRLRGRRLALAVIAACGPPLAYSSASVARLLQVHPYQQAAGQTYRPGRPWHGCGQNTRRSIPSVTGSSCCRIRSGSKAEAMRRSAPRSSCWTTCPCTRGGGSCLPTWRGTTARSQASTEGRGCSDSLCRNRGGPPILGTRMRS